MHVYMLFHSFLPMPTNKHDLPPGSSAQQVIYHRTGRAFLVTLGVISLASLSTGMWLFSLAAPYFYWFAVPTTFVMGYLFLSCECDPIFAAQECEKGKWDVGYAMYTRSQRIALKKLTVEKLRPVKKNALFWYF